jgi:hypothetical protein
MSAALSGKTNVECWPAAKGAGTALIANRKLRNFRVRKLSEIKNKNAVRISPNDNESIIG